MNKISKFGRIGIDTNIFIYYFGNNPEFGWKAKLIFDELGNNGIVAMTSIITISEILSSANLTKLAIKHTQRKFFSIPSLEIHQVDEIIALESAAIRREYGFKLFDSIQLTTALVNKAQAFITSDERLKGFKKLKVLLLKDIS